MICKARCMYCSKITKKGQMTIPVHYRRKYQLKEGSTVAFKETDAGLVIEPILGINDSAGSMARYGNARTIVDNLLESRKEPYR